MHILFFYRYDLIELKLIHLCGLKMMCMKGNLSRMMSRASEINLEISTEKKLLLLWKCGLRVYIKSKYVQYIMHNMLHSQCGAALNVAGTKTLAQL